jgi:hypothetical protein
MWTFLCGGSVAENVETDEESLCGCCRVILRLLESLIYNCYPNLRKLVLETKELEISEKSVNQ